MTHEKSNTHYGHMMTSYHLHPSPYACDQDESVIP